MDCSHVVQHVQTDLILRKVALKHQHVRLTEDELKDLSIKVIRLQLLLLTEIVKSFWMLLSNNLQSFVAKTQ